MGHTGVGEKSDGRVLRSLVLNQSIPYPRWPSESTKKAACYEWLCFHGFGQMNDSPAEAGGCPCLARTTVGGTGQSWDGFSSVLLPGRSVSQGLPSACSFPTDGFCFHLPSCTPPPHLTLQPLPSGPPLHQPLLTLSRAEYRHGSDLSKEL